MFKRDKWLTLTLQCGYDRYSVPIFKACGRNKSIPLFKTLLSSFCSNDCKFCALRCGRRTRRERWEPEEFARVAFRLWKMGKIKGVFLSSSVEKDPDHTVEKEIEAIEFLRKLGFKEYVHLRLMPGVSRDLIKRGVEIADRVGINLEMPGKNYYDNMKLYLSFREDVVKRLKWVAKEVEKAQKEGKCKAGVDTQFIVGASDETDEEIIKMSDWLYYELKARRVYYSAFEPIKDTPLEKKEPENPWREYRLYQASFLLRDYSFKADDFIFDENGMLNLKEDPKLTIAKEIKLKVDINEADFHELIRVPGIGLKTAKMIIKKRPIKNLSLLRSLGVNLRRAAPFIELENFQDSLKRYFNIKI